MPCMTCLIVQEILILLVAASLLPQRLNAKKDQPCGVFVFECEPAGEVNPVLLLDLPIGGRKLPRGRSGHIAAAWLLISSIQLDANLGLAWRKGHCMYL